MDNGDGRAILESSAAKFGLGFGLGIGSVEVEVVEFELCGRIACLCRLRCAALGVQNVGAVMLQAVVLTREASLAAGEGAAVRFLASVDAIMTRRVAAGGEGLVATGMLARITLLAADGDGARTTVLAVTFGHAVDVTVGHGAVEGVHAIRAATGGTTAVLGRIKVSTRSVPLTWGKDAGS